MRGSERLPESPVDLIATHYGLHVSTSSPVDGGDEAVAWRAAAEQPLLIHQSPSWRTADELGWVHELLAGVTPILPEAVGPLRTRDYLWLRRSGDGDSLSGWLLAHRSAAQVSSGAVLACVGAAAGLVVGP
jgi:hypothetical protein